MPRILLLSFAMCMVYPYAHYWIIDKLFNNYLIDLVDAIIGTLFIFSTSVVLSMHNRMGWLKYIGTLSMPIYLLHILYASGVRIILSKFIGINVISLYICIGVVVGVAFPFLTYCLVKWIGVERISFGR